MIRDDGPGMTPAERAAAEVEARGKDRFVDGCTALLERRPSDVDDELVAALGGDHGVNVLAGAEGGKEGYWPRVWAARGLLHVWDVRATAAIIGALADEAWRVRETAAKVVARHVVGDALQAAAGLASGDDNPRVRRAASRAVESIIGKES